MVKANVIGNKGYPYIAIFLKTENENEDENFIIIINKIGMNKIPLTIDFAKITPLSPQLH